MPRDKITIHNSKSAFYREVHVDGAFGGITPRGLLQLSFFAERFPIPKSSEFEVKNEQIGNLIKNSDDSKEGILRDFEFGIYMDMNVAKALVEILSQKITELESLGEKQKK